MELLANNNLLYDLKKPFHHLCCETSFLAGLEKPNPKHLTMQSLKFVVFGKMHEPPVVKVHTWLMLELPKSAKFVKKGEERKKRIENNQIKRISK